MENQQQTAALTTAVEEKMKGLREVVAQTQITNDEELAAVADKIKAVKTMAKFIRAEMEKYTKPAQEIINNARGLFLPYERECESAEEDLKYTADAYMAKQEAARQQEEDVIAKKLESGRIKETTAIKKLEEVGEERKTVSTGNTQLQRKKVKEVFIEKPELVPDEYWVIDEKKVRKVALAGVEIPGVVVKEISQISIK